MSRYHERPKSLARAMAKMLIKHRKKFEEAIEEISKVIPIFKKQEVDKSVKRAKKYLRDSKD